MNGMSDMLTDLTTTGKASFKSFGVSILKTIAQITNQLLVAYAVQKAMGWITSSSDGPQGGGIGSPAFMARFGLGMAVISLNMIVVVIPDLVGSLNQKGLCMVVSSSSLRSLPHALVSVIFIA
jgi:hypothetical protein